LAEAAAPELSVIVPVYRHWDLVPALLAALAAQTLPPERFEILLVDNGPEPPPPLAFPPNARILACPAPGSYAARNAGAAAARGVRLAFTDADCRPEPGWLKAFAAAAAADPAALFAGPVRMQAGPAPNPFEIYDLVRGIPQARFIRHGYAATANLTMPAAVFRRLGGFDPARFSGGDAEFCRRAGRAGHRLRLVEAATVAHPCRASWAALVTKARRIKGGQIGAGPLPRRLYWLLRTLTPPLREAAIFLASGHPAPHRRIAARLRFRLWAVELLETGRILLGATPERR
jgi:GT2 family glycosyltransferase